MKKVLNKTTTQETDYQTNNLKEGDVIKIVVNDGILKEVKGVIKRGSFIASYNKYTTTIVEGLFLRIEEIKWNENSSVLDRNINYYCDLYYMYDKLYADLSYLEKHYHIIKIN